MIKRVLPNGVRLLMEPLPHIRSAAVGLWIDAGSRNETPEMHGGCHFIEHMYFKGTTRRDVFELADAMNLLGGQFNAFTSQEAMCLHARVIDEDVAETLDLLVEVFRNSTFPEEEVQRERNVILEEYKMIEDTPDDLVMDLFHQAMWGDDPVGRPVIGSLETITRLQRDALVGFSQNEFTADRIVLAVAGAMDVEAFAQQAERLLADTPTANGRVPSRAARPEIADQLREKETEQAQFCMGCLGPSRTHEDRYAFAMLSSILGGGMSSRVFKEVREKRGLAYSIGSYQQAFCDTGCFGIAGGTSPENMPDVIGLCREEIRKTYRDGVAPAELRLAKEQARISLLLSLESAGARMSRLAEQEIYFGKQIELDEILRRIEEVTESDVQASSEKWLKDAPAALAVVAPSVEPALRVSSF